MIGIIAALVPVPMPSFVCGKFGFFPRLLQQNIKTSPNRLIYLFTKTLAFLLFPPAGRWTPPADWRTLAAMAENIDMIETPHPVDERSVWSAADLAADRSWEYRLTTGDRAELDAAVAAVTGADGIARPGFTRDDFALPRLAATLEDIYGPIERRARLRGPARLGHRQPPPGPDGRAVVGAWLLPWPRHRPKQARRADRRGQGSW